jgi:hypothetical protein
MPEPGRRRARRRSLARHDVDLAARDPFGRAPAGVEVPEVERAAVDRDAALVDGQALVASRGREESAELALVLEALLDRVHRVGQSAHV